MKLLPSVFSIGFLEMLQGLFSSFVLFSNVFPADFGLDQIGVAFDVRLDQLNLFDLTRPQGFE